MTEARRLCVAAAAIPNGAGQGQVARAAAEAARLGASWLVLPEATIPGYPPSFSPGHTQPASRGEAGRLACRLAGEHRLGLALGCIEEQRSRVILAWPEARCVRSARVDKRFPSPTESLRWRAGEHPGRVRVTWPHELELGVLICADLLQRRAWAELEGVDLVLVSAAWPHYHESRKRLLPGLGWVARESETIREAMLGAGARSLGAPVLFANASGGAFSGGASVRDIHGAMTGEKHIMDDGTVLAVAEVELAERESRPETERLPARWRLFLPFYGVLGRWRR